MNAQRGLVCDFPEWRQKSLTKAQEDLRIDLLSSANWCLVQPIVPQPAPGPSGTRRSEPSPPGVSPYSDAYLLAHESFEIATFSFERCAQELAFAWGLTGEERYRNRAVEWVREVVEGWERWEPAGNPLDMFATRTLHTLVLACDWLGESLPENLRTSAFLRVKDCTTRCAEAWQEGWRHPEPVMLNNHNWFNAGSVGLAACWLATREEGWEPLVQLLQGHVADLLEWSLARDGDYLDKGCYLMYGWRWAFPFLLALERRGDSSLLDHPALARAARWIASVLSPSDLNWIEWPVGYMHRFILFAIASHHRLSWLQGLALRLRERMNTQNQPSWEEWLASGAHWNLLCYDPTLDPTPPEDEQLLAAAHFRDTGWALLRERWDPEKVSVSLYAGPASGKNFHDQGHVQIEAYGSRLLQYPEYPSYGYISAHRMIAYTMSNLSGETLLVNGLGQASGRYPDQWPGSRHLGKEPEPPLGRIIAFEVADKWQYAAADLSRAYQAFDPQGMWGSPLTLPQEWANAEGNRLARYLRHVVFAPPGWVLVFDDIEAHPGKPVTLEWHFGTEGVVQPLASKEAIVTKGRAALDCWLIAPSEALLGYTAAYHSELGKWITVTHEEPRQTCRLIFLFHARRQAEKRPQPIWRLTDHGWEIELPEGRVEVSIEGRVRFVG